MSWVCPVCSNPNADALTECFVCGESKPARAASSGAAAEPASRRRITVSPATEERSLGRRRRTERVRSGETRIYYSAMECWWDSIKRLFK